MTTREKIITAQVSSNLGERKSAETGDVDIVRACGMAGVRAPLGLALWRLRATGDFRGLRSVADDLVQLLEAKGPTTTSPVAAVEAALVYWLDDVCKVCLGRGFAVIADTPMLSDQPCEACDGVGRAKFRGSEDPAAAWCLDRIRMMEAQVAADIMRRLNDELDSIAGHQHQGDQYD